MNDRRSFLGRLVGSRAAGVVPIIAEIKVSTPTAGELLRRRPVEDIACHYERAGMACVSVVTGRWFGGSPALLDRVARATSLPILQKDFIASRSAIQRARELGAAAVLLTARLIDAHVLDRLASQALCLGLTPFIEVASAGEMQGLRVDSEAILAVNNRDITVKETDQGGIVKSLSLLDAARASGAGAVVSASAITTAVQARRLREAGFDGLLVGTALLRAPDLQQVLSGFRTSLLGVEG